MSTRLREAASFARTVVTEFLEDDCMSMAASLAYYTVFSLAPMLVIVIVVAGLFVTPEQATAAVDAQLEGLIGPEGAAQIGVMIAHVRADPGGSLVVRTLGLLAVLAGATAVMVQLQTALNRAWNVMPDPESGGAWTFLTKRLLSFGMILGMAVLLLVSLLLSAVLTAIADRAAYLLPMGSALAPRLTELGVSFVVTTLLFMALYKLMPEARIRWSDVAVGSVVTALLFTIGKSLIALYLGQSNVGTAYGGASSLAVVLVWVYYSAVIVLFGAEFTQVWTRRYGGGLHPVAGAVIASEYQRRKVLVEATAKGEIPGER
jgi:membrane protein